MWKSSVLMHTVLNPLVFIESINLLTTLSRPSAPVMRTTTDKFSFLLINGLLLNIYHELEAKKFIEFIEWLVLMSLWNKEPLKTFSHKIFVKVQITSNKQDCKLPKLWKKNLVEDRVCINNFDVLISRLKWEDQIGFVLFG